MSIVEEFAEVFVGLLLLIMSAILIFDNIIEPSFEQININYQARADKAVTFSYSFNDNNEVHDQKVGRLPGIDPGNGIYDGNDTGNSRRYFRAEQFIMLPAVDTDVSSNTGVGLMIREPSVSLTVNQPLGSSTRGLYIGSDPMTLRMPYIINRDSLYDKQITFDSVQTGGVIGYLNSKAIYGSASYGTQRNGSNIMYGGFNITVESGIHTSSKKDGNTVIFVEGRVPAR